MISVCLATYNGERYLREQIDSILTQLGSKDELIISDDGSTDSTLDIISSYTDPRIKLLHNNSNHGINANFNNALCNATGDIIFLSDQDDIWLEGKVKECLKGLEDADCVIHNAIIKSSTNSESSSDFFQLVNAHKGIIHNFIHNGYLGCAMAFKKEILKEALPIPNHSSMFHDVWIGNIAALKYKVIFLDFHGIIFRRHESTNSITFHRRMNISGIIKNRLSVATLLIKRLLFKK